MITKSLAYVVLMLFICSVRLEAQDPRDVTGYFSEPRNTPFGIVCTNSYSSALYLLTNGSPESLLAAPGCGNYFTTSFDGQCIGLKIVDQDENQTPVVYSLASRTIKALSLPARQVGQVSFSRDGRIAFTRGEQLVVIDGSVERLYRLGTYPNIAPISPDGNAVVYNDNNDQLWMYRLESGENILISDGKLGYFNPRWSPDGAKILYESLNGLMKVYELQTKNTFDLGKGNHASWSGDSRLVAFSMKEFVGPRLVNSDLYVSGFDGSNLQQITSTPDVMEMDPAFADGSNEILCQTFSRRSIVSMRIDSRTTGLPKVTDRKEIMLPGAETFTMRPVEMVSAGKATSQLDIPYVHQAYDTPDWFNGDAACAPTSAIMLLAYYNILPPWPTYCSTPYVHYNSWGNYVSSQYQFKEVQYLPRANDPSGKPAWGGYGYMWSGSNSPHSRMAGYYTLHGMTAIQTEATPYSVAYAEVSSGHPFTLCVMLTSAGHLVLAHGIGTEPHTFVFNDCWGDKNRGYKNYYGKNVRYDWPGYNNGYQNLVSVEWCIATRYDPPVAGDTLIDDLQFSKGFSMSAGLPSSMSLWKDKNAGYQGHFWYAYSRNGSSVDTCFATWTPTLPEDAVYEISAYIPAASNATEARYQIVYKGGSTIRSIDQSKNGDAWVSLGSYPFAKGNAGLVRLGDQCSVANQILSFDAMRWSRTSNGVTRVQDGSETPGRFSLSQNYPNPFNPRTNFEFRIANCELVILTVCDVLGREVAVLVNDVRTAGVYTVRWNASSLPSGVYFYRLQARPTDGGQAGAFVETKKMVFMK